MEWSLIQPMKQDIRNSSEVKVNLGGDRKEEIGQNKKKNGVGNVGSLYNKGGWEALGTFCQLWGIKSCSGKMVLL